MSINILYLPKNFIPPQNRFLATPLITHDQRLQKLSLLFPQIRRSYEWYAARPRDYLCKHFFLSQGCLVQCSVVVV